MRRYLGGVLNMFSALRALATVILISTACNPHRALAQTTPARAVTEAISSAESHLTYLAAATEFDKLIDPSSDTAVTSAIIARLVDAAKQMAGPNPTDAYKLAAIRKAIYVAGPWNYNRAFSYDKADPLGQIIRNKLLSTYIKTRQGNCVSMPTLFLIVADRMGLNVHLAAAPLHLFVRYTDASGADHNLETTSGGHEARTEWYRRALPMTDHAIANGIYMRTLTKRESIAEMAITVLEFLIDQHRYREAIDVADAILAINPREAYVMVEKGSAIAGLMQTEFVDKYPNPALIPANLRPRYQMLAAANAKMFKDAEALGWAPER